MVQITEATKTTPFVRIDGANGMVEIRGKSGTAKALTFYGPVIEFVRNIEGIDTFTLILFMEYFNTSSAKCLFDIIKAIDKMPKKGIETKIVWYIEEDDEDMRDTADDYQDLVDIEIECVEVEEEKFLEEIKNY